MTLFFTVTAIGFLAICLVVFGLVALISDLLATVAVGGDPFWFTREEILLTGPSYIKPYRSRLLRTKDGVKYAYVYPKTKIGLVYLHDDGTTSGPTIFITHWHKEI